MRYFLWAFWYVRGFVLRRHVEGEREALERAAAAARWKDVAENFFSRHRDYRDAAALEMLLAMVERETLRRAARQPQREDWSRGREEWEL